MKKSLKRMDLLIQQETLHQKYFLSEPIPRVIIYFPFPSLNLLEDSSSESQARQALNESHLNHSLFGTIISCSQILFLMS
jgi:hypothetical protein